MNDVPILPDETASLLMQIFRRPVSSETIFLLTNTLKTANNPQTIQQIFTTYLKWLDESTRSKISKPPEMLASQGIYLCMILRYYPLSQASKESLYIDNRHFLIAAWKAYYPYIPMFIIYFLIPCIITSLDLEAPWRLSSSNDNSASSNESSPRQSPLNEPSRPIMKQHSAEDLEIINRVREGVNSPPLRNSSSDSELSPIQSRHQTASTQSIIMRLIEQCPVNSPERQSLSELRRTYMSGYNYYCSRLGIQQQKTELAIFLDIPSMLNMPLSEDDIQKAIFMHANKILTTDVNFLPHHFDRSISCLNYDIAKEIEPLADWVKAETLNELIFLCKELKHAICRELLLLVIKKNVTLCSHQLKRLPETWREEILQLYTTPRWKFLNTHTSTQHDAETSEALLDYYRMNLCYNGDMPSFAEKLTSLAAKLSNQDEKDKFLKRINDTNRSFYALQLCGYDDLESIDQLKFVNEHDNDLEDIFDISRNFIFPYRVESHLYLFDYKLVPSMLQSKQNPFTRASLSPELIDDMTNRYHKYNAMGLGLGCTNMTDFIDELVHGRKVQTVCTCASQKNYVRKLARMLRGYGVKIEQFELVDLRDAAFKLGLMQIDHGRPDSVEKLAHNLYKLIKDNSNVVERESLKQAVSTIIHLYR